MSMQDIYYFLGSVFFIVKLMGMLSEFVEKSTKNLVKDKVLSKVKESGFPEDGAKVFSELFDIFSGIAKKN